MSRRHYYKHRHKEEDIDVTPLLNVMVVLVSFLIFSAVFSRITIQELTLPSQAGAGPAQDKPPVTIEIIVRKDSLEISDGKNITATIPNPGTGYDIPELTGHLLLLKKKYGDKQDITILLEPDIEYGSMIQVMDAAKVAELKVDGQHQRIVLFPQVSIGDTP